MENKTISKSRFRYNFAKGSYGMSYIWGHCWEIVILLLFFCAKTNCGEFMGGMLISTGCESVRWKHLSKTHCCEYAMGSLLWLLSPRACFSLANGPKKQASLKKIFTIRYFRRTGWEFSLQFFGGGDSITLEEKITVHHISSKLLFLR